MNVPSSLEYPQDLVHWSSQLSTSRPMNSVQALNFTKAYIWIILGKYLTSSFLICKLKKKKSLWIAVNIEWIII